MPPSRHHSLALAPRLTAGRCVALWTCTVYLDSFLTRLILQVSIYTLAASHYAASPSPAPASAALLGSAACDAAAPEA